MSLPRVLFLSPGTEDYLLTPLLHGLRELLGENVVDAPKHAVAYRSFPDDRPLYGRGFSVFKLLDEVDVERSRPMERALAGEFDLVVFGDMWRQWQPFAEWGKKLPASTRVVTIDAFDKPAMYPYYPKWWRRPGNWLVPRAQTRSVYLKRELGPMTRFWRWYMLAPPPLAARMPLNPNVRPFAFSFPEEKIVAEPRPPAAKAKLLNAHVVDPEVAARAGGETRYLFDTEEAYYADLRASRYGITTKKGGWDCMRHYEIAANGAVPAFRDLHRKPAECAPHGLDETNCVPYRDYDDLMRRLDAIGDEQYAALQRGALAWARANSTRRRAEELLAAAGLAVPASR